MELFHRLLIFCGKIMKRKYLLTNFLLFLVLLTVQINSVFSETNQSIFEDRIHFAYGDQLFYQLLIADNYSLAYSYPLIISFDGGLAGLLSNEINRQNYPCFAMSVPVGSDTGSEFSH